MYFEFVQLITDELIKRIIPYKKDSNIREIFSKIINIGRV